MFFLDILNIPVLKIVFISVVDPDPSPGSDFIWTDPDPSINKQKSKKNLDFYYFVISS